MTQGKYQRINAIAVIIIALSAVVVAVWQTELTRQHNRRTVRPYLDVDLKFDGGTALTIKNKGEGAAIITSFSLESDGTRFPSWDSLFYAADESLRTGLSRTFDPGDVLGAHEELVLCQFPRNSSTEVQIDLQIGYESIYAEADTFKTRFTWGGGSVTNAETN